MGQGENAAGRLCQPDEFAKQPAGGSEGEWAGSEGEPLKDDTSIVGGQIGDGTQAGMDVFANECGGGAWFKCRFGADQEACGLELVDGCRDGGGECGRG